MTKISDHQSAGTIKMLVLGDSGSGKTGALASLAAAGYNLRILDIDNGLDVLRNVITDPKTIYPKETAERVEFVTFTDTMRTMAGKLVPVKASVWQDAVNQLDNWKLEDGKSLGGIGTWTPKEVLVIDTLSFIANAALKFIMMLNMRLGQKPHQSDWGEAQALVESLLEKLYDKSVNCNVVVNCHVKYMEDENKVVKCFPESVGKALSPKIGRYFNNVVLARTSGNQRKFITTSTNQLELKTSAPMRVKNEYPIATGLADLFKDLKG